MPPRFTIAVKTQGKDGSTGGALAEGGDFHRVTAATLAWGALRLLERDHQAGGVLAPSMAFDPESLLNGLRVEGVRWTASGRGRPESPAPRCTP